jgi:hypothetical protein
VEVIVRNAIALLVLVLLFSCSKAEKGATSVATNAAAPPVQQAAERRPEQLLRVGGAPPAPMRNDGAGLMAAPAAEEPSAAPKPMIVRSAEMRIIVADTTKTVDEVTKTVEAMGGFVSGSNIWRDGELMRASLKLRIPADKLTSALQAIRGLAKRVDNETIASEDVSQEYVDLESQLRNLEATETELRELLIVARKNSRKASDVLEVHEQLMMIRGQIEQAKGRMRYLSQVAAMSAISLEVIPDAIAQPVVEPGWQPVVIARNAMRALVGALQSIATVGIWFLVYVLPIFGILALLIVALWKISRRSRTNIA